jgi:anti-sigma factor RsiW
MNENRCLSNQELVLHYYGELPADGEQVRHLSGCPHCAERFAELGRDLARLPELAYEPDHAAATRMAARLQEKLQRRRSRWLPVMGAATAATLALVVATIIWSPGTQPVQTVKVTNQAQAQLNYDDDLPDVDFLDDLDLLQNLDVLSQIEGV